MELEQKPGYNEAKLSTLSIIHKIGKVTPCELALIEKIDPTAASMRLIRYHKWGLLNRKKRGKSYAYAITERGAGRLAWLQETNDPTEDPSTTPRCRIIRDVDTGEVLRVLDLDGAPEEELSEVLILIGKRRCKVETLY